MNEDARLSKAYADATVANRMAGRRSDEVAAFVLPHLEPGMTLVDVGCGPGSITLGFAVAVAPGQVLGLDIEAAQVERARDLAKEQGVGNVRFEVGSAYDLPLESGSADVVFAHTLLVYLQEPVRALREFRRVLKSDGFVAIREQDITTCVIEPPSAALETAISLLVRHRNLSGDHSAGRRLRTLLMEAGFERTEAVAFARTWESGALVDAATSLLRTSAYRATALEKGWSNDADVEELLVDMRAWAARPDAFAAQLAFGVLGWLN
jgi:ubiquinone/menaquinone biosynthesis C-methylase UbiE